jgi:hypothetical protein
MNGAFLEHLRHYKAEGGDMLERTVTGEVMGPTLPNKIKMCIHAMEDSQFTCNQKV